MILNSVSVDVYRVFAPKNDWTLKTSAVKSDFKLFQVLSTRGESWKIRPPRGAAALLLQSVAHVGADASESEMWHREMASV